MKKIIYLITTVLCIGMLSGCGNKEKTEQQDLQPEEQKIEEICQLATYDYITNTVAKNMKLPEKGWTHWLEKERHVWIQYKGKVSVGVEIPEDFLQVSGTDVKIKTPKAVVLDTNILEDTLNQDSFIISEDGFWNSNEVTVEFQQKLIAQSQKELRKQVEEDEELLKQVVDRAKYLIENYVTELGKVTETEYTIQWVDK